MNRVEELVKLIVDAANAYYNTEAPLVSDEVFDSWTNELKSLDPDNKILSTPGWGATLPVTHKKKFNHTFQVGGLDKVQHVDFDYASLWTDPGAEYTQSCKLDGLTGVAYYGKINPVTGKRMLKYVLTRNDGDVGLDITENLKYCNIPKEVPAHIEWVRGEVVTTWDAANKFEYSHPRNMACGLANSDEQGDAHKELHFVVYESDSGHEITHQDRLVELDNLGFEVVRWAWIPYTPSIEERNKFFNYTAEDFVKYEYPLDGSVIINNQTGEGFAVKYPTPIVEVKVTSIVNQLSSRGRVIPVIEFEPVFLAGATLNYCSGFNYVSIKEHGIGPGAIIRITRANEVIPHWVDTVSPVEAVIPEYVEENGVQYKTYWYDSHLEFIYDKTLDSLQTLLGWRSPHGVGGAKIKTLIEKFEITKHQELATLAANTEMFESCRNKIREIFGETYGDRMVELLLSVHKGYTVAELLESTYSRNLGAEASDRLMKIYENDPARMATDLHVLGKLPENIENQMPTYVVGEGVVQNIELIKNVLRAGFNIITPAPEVDNSAAIKITLTGTLSKSRPALMEEWSGKAVEVDIKQAQYLITDNPNSGSSKNKAAVKLGVPVITEAEFRKIIGV
ncbi:NAD-dependent DNA ligase LigA [Ralstonia phage RP13]|nr:NAD-dependent DNA ligase LigA [Ralstonia phage RP13]